ncbi:MAG: UDP-glucose 4-epimerase GalE, partial [Sulfurovaceae bacterium]|nr:UDP-glucose 4-epimerase GalE [Sulfurovaceae bacterium]
YYDNNVSGTINLCKVMSRYGCKSIVFSSSATVYGNPASNPITENFPVGQGITNPYGRSKYIIEEILRDVFTSDNSWKIVILRYFNPVGAYKSGTIGEDPSDIPNNLMPFIAQTAIGKREYLNVFGDDYNTLDGTGVRDYIHVMDLADGHVKAIDRIKSFDKIMTINLGTGNGYSVLDIIKAYEKASGKKIPYKIAPRRDGDIDVNYANPTYAKEVLGWSATRELVQMCEDSWRWQSQNPNGYRNE